MPAIESDGFWEFASTARSKSPAQFSIRVRALHRLLQKLGPDTRARQLRGEASFWRQWFATKGLAWPEDYAMRFDADAPVQDHLSMYIDRLAEQHIEILDIGSGPVTKLGKVHPSKALSISAIDVLADEYNAMLEEFDLTPLVATQYGDAENLPWQFGDRRFDIVHAENSLDHMIDPLSALDGMLTVTRPGGFVVLLHIENEGRNEFYQDLHKWDLTWEDGHFVIAGPGPDGPRRDATNFFSGKAEVECSLHDGYVLVGMKKRSEP